jgi:hypothetical protein
VALRQPAGAPAPAIFINHQLSSERPETEKEGRVPKGSGENTASSPHAASPRCAAARQGCWRPLLSASAPRPPSNNFLKSKSQFIKTKTLMFQKICIRNEKNTCRRGGSICNLLYKSKMYKECRKKLNKDLECIK